MRKRSLDDDGAVLVIALVFVSVVGLLLSVVITLSHGGIVAASTFADDRRIAYEVDGATKTLITRVRGDSSLGLDGGSCPTYVPPVGESGTSLEIRCAGAAGSGGSFDDQPPFALLMTGNKAGEGINETGNAPLTVDGSIYTRGSVDLTKGGSKTSLTVYGDLTAQGTCQPIAQITSPGGSITCNAADDGSWNLQYPARATTVPTPVDPTPSCDASELTWFPGTYTEVPRQPSGCSKKTWWFQPGVYYFDFPAGADTWNLDTQKVTVIGGTSTGTWVSPGGCDPAAANGVQFIFGGTSKLVNASQGSLELCASQTSAASKQKIALYGLTTGSRTSTTATRTDPAPVLTNFVGLSTAASTINSVEVAAAYTKSDTSSAVYAFASAVPAGSIVTSASLEVAHHESSKVDTTITSSTGDSATLPACVKVTACTDTVPLTVAGSYGYQAFQALTATFTASAKMNKNDPDQTAALDGVDLVVTYKAPALEAYCDTCTLLTSTVDQNLFLKGTVYAPTGGFDLTVHNSDTTIFQRGLIGRTLSVKVSASSTQTEAPFQLPHASGGDRVVLFTGYRASGATKTPVLRAVVRFTDYRTSGTTTLAFPGYTAKTTAWVQVRPGAN